MTDPNTPKPPSWKPLDATQRRVLGVLIEKAKTTPAGYPMTVNAVVTGCNQKSNREPLMDLEAFDVEKTLDELRTLGVVSEIDWMGRAAKYKHHGYEWLGVSKVEIAVMTELLLRGEQTLGDLRSRAARMEPIADLAALKPVVDGLVQRRLMIELTLPGRGQVVSHNLYENRELAELRARYAGHVARPTSTDDDATLYRSAAPGSAAAGPTPGSAIAPRGAHPSTDNPGPSANTLAELSQAVADLRTEVMSLREQVGDLARRVESQG